MQWLQNATDDRWYLDLYTVFAVHAVLGNMFHESLEKAKCILELNQYLPTFYEPIVKESLDRIINQPDSRVEQTSTKPQEKADKTSLIIQYRGKCTENYARALHKIGAPCTIIMTLRKLKTVLSVPQNSSGENVKKWGSVQTQFVHAALRAMSARQVAI